MDTVNHIELTVHQSQIRPALRALLYAIFFQRNTDAIEPDDFELLDSHIAMSSSSSSLATEINAKIEEFVGEYLEDPKNVTGEMAVVFLQKKPKKGWFAITEELIPWEEHLITLRWDAKSIVPQVLQRALLQVTTFCVHKKGNVPPLVGNSENSNVSHQILIAPPSPTELFAPSPPTYPARLTSPPPGPLTHTTPATALALAKDLATPNMTSERSSENAIVGSTRRGTSPAIAIGMGGGGYLEQAKDGLRAVGAKAGAGVGWGGRAIGGAFGRGGGGGGGAEKM
ncbi:uncharacterized protein I303_107032 [Kwoniella dejecticola CBS 10117]|uniref:Autophagy-related protein 101 n=1 Tax=Kwoniella dejecticola CBS 10117 TaxID=1296121 RepID=A0A1A5ZYI7_9TREE|nr:uncharacterized protein I303_06433 [Kwoniella dejecticola CBS 10117]OBR82876.1 hypothetical protein I303_06433 [Kwoniella dejecticola CBS 10117]